MMSYCRFCDAPLSKTVVDLGLSPIANAFRDKAASPVEPQVYYPLITFVCEKCWLVQLSDVETPSHFNQDYPYFSSYSRSWLDHAKAYADTMIEMMSLDAKSRGVEIGSNDGYLLRNFKSAGIPVLGIEPSGNVAAAAIDDHGVETLVKFFDLDCAKELSARGLSADLMVANNVLAHVPRLNAFVAGFKHLLKRDGCITFEFPHLLRLLKFCQFDTIYHEHYSYFSLSVVERILRAHGLTVFGVEELSTHGGSLRIFSGHQDGDLSIDPKFAHIRDKVAAEESTWELDSVKPYEGFRDNVVQRKIDFLSFLIRAAEDGKSVRGYGAPAKGNTFLNYCGVGPELLPYTVDLNPHKQGKCLPGCDIPIFDPEKLMDDKPEYIVILPWNIGTEIAEQLSPARDWGCQFVTAIPRLEIF